MVVVTDRTDWPRNDSYLGKQPSHAVVTDPSSHKLVDGRVGGWVVVVVVVGGMRGGGGCTRSEQPASWRKE